MASTEEEIGANRDGMRPPAEGIGKSSRRRSSLEVGGGREREPILRPQHGPPEQLPGIRVNLPALTSTTRSTLMAFVSPGLP